MRRGFPFAGNNDTDICHCQWILGSHWGGPSVGDEDALRRSWAVVNVSATTIRSSLDHLTARNYAVLPLVENSAQEGNTIMRLQTDTKLLEWTWRNRPSISNLCHPCNILSWISYVLFHHAVSEVEETAQKYLKLYWTLCGNKPEFQKNKIKLHWKGFSYRTSWNAASSMKNKYKFHFKLLAHITVDNLITKITAKSFKTCFFLGFLLSIFWVWVGFFVCLLAFLK